MKQYDIVFKIFGKKEGCQHIATRFALKGIEEIIKNKNIKTVFEFGIGIGTIPYLIGSLNNKITYYGTEDNEFCLNAIKENLPLKELNIEFNLLNKYDEFKENFQFDLIIIDGKFEDIEFLKRIAHKNTIIFIEGDRAEQQELVKKAFPFSLKNRIVCITKNQKNSPFYNEENNNFEGGYTVFRLNTNFINKMSWYKTKLVTSIKYRFRDN